VIIVIAFIVGFIAGLLFIPLWTHFVDDGYRWW